MVYKTLAGNDSLEETVTYTTTASNKYSEDWTEEEIMTYVRHVKTDDAALYNLRKILKQHNKRLSKWELIKLLLN